MPYKIRFAMSCADEDESSAWALGYAVARDAVRMLDDDEKGAHSVLTPGGEQNMTIITEGGLYSRRPVLVPVRPDHHPHQQQRTGTAAAPAERTLNG
jgi:hypothetical protein